MKYVLLVGFVCACTLAAQPKPGTGSIEGDVFNSVTRAPVRKATVTLTTPQIRLVADSDAEGRFQFTDLPPGTYRLSANHSGFLDHAARRPITLGPNDHVTDAEIRLPPQGLITGYVLDEDGDPVGGARITIFKQVYRDGRKQWDRDTFNANTTTITNDTGEYRLANLSPGRYLVRAESQRPMVDNRYGDRSKMVNVPAYYPNALSEEAASPVEVGAGAEIRGIDIHLFKRVRPPSFHVSGKVTGLRPDSQIIVNPNLLPADGSGSAWNGEARPPDYTFDASVPPGQYTVFAHVYSGGPEAYATGSLTVAGNITGLVLTMSPPPDVTGQISVTQGGTQVNLKGVRVTLSRIPVYLNVSEVQSDATGKLVFAKPIPPPGHYSIDVNVRSLPEGCYVQKVKLGGQEVSADDFEILTSTHVEIVLSKTAGTITGSVADADRKPFPNSSVTLIPADEKARPVRQAVDDDGNFKFTNLRPGKYKLFAWEEVDDGLWPDPDFRKKYENRAIEITVDPSETKNTQLRVIAAEEMK